MRARSRSWWTSVFTLCVTLLVLLPIEYVVVGAFRSRPHGAFTLQNLRLMLYPPFLAWLRNSLSVTLATVAVTLIVATPGGYVLSRGRGALVSTFSLLLFVAQALPVVVAIVPIFILFSKLGLVDNLLGVTVIYVGLGAPAATWMMGIYYDSVPIEIEEAGWMDGASVFGGFWRLVLRNSLPALVTTAMFTFLVAWNDYLIMLVFIHSTGNYLLPMGQLLFSPASGGIGLTYALLTMLPPVIVFAALHRFFAVGGLGSSVVRGG